MRQKCLCTHEQVCDEQWTIHASERLTDVLCPVVDLDQDQVFSTVSLSIGQGNVFIEKENKDLFFPKTIEFFPVLRDVPVVKTGWECKGVTKGVAGVKSRVFKKSQRDFLLTLFNNNGGPKIRERDAQLKMVATFKDKDEDSDLSLSLVLSGTQIKSWISSEAR